MRIAGPTRTAAPQAGTSGRRADAGSGASFVPVTGEAPARTPATSAGAAPLAGLDALIALQAVDEVDPERPRARRKAVRRGRDILDLLDRVKIGLLYGEVSTSDLDSILGILSELEPSGDEALDSLIAEIGLRAEVELAKLGRYVTPQ